MRKWILLGIIGCWALSAFANKHIDTSEENWTYGRMHQWRVYTAFQSTNNVEVLNNEAYGLSNKSLFSVNKQSEEITYHNRLTGLNGSLIIQMAKNPTLDALLLCYQNGQIDIIDTDGDLHNISDLYLKQMNSSKVVNHVYMHNQKAYLSMKFGVIMLDMHKCEIQDTYYLGDEGAEVEVLSTAILGDSIYAVSSRILYAASLHANLMDYSSWSHKPLPSGAEINGFYDYDDKLYMLRDTILWMRDTAGWQVCPTPFAIGGIQKTGDELYVFPTSGAGAAKVGSDYTLQFQELGVIYDIEKDQEDYWLCTASKGLYYTRSQRPFFPHGPVDNTAYRMRFFGDRLYVVPGGRWYAQNRHAGNIMYLENDHWTNVATYYLVDQIGFIPYDLMNVAQDPNDANHYFVTSYGAGLLEMRGREVLQLYTPHNSPLRSAVPETPERYTRTDGVMYDDQGYLWVLNTHDEGVNNVHVISPEFWQTRDLRYWSSFNLHYHGERVVLHTPGEIMVDNRNPQWKWIPLCRQNPGLLLLKDNGTPANHGDDEVIFRDTWYDQNGHQIKPQQIHSMAQDWDDMIWIGTDAGLFLLPSSVDFATSDRCERIIIPRNDGTNLADYLLDSEKITSIVVDGANRKWIGTEKSGVFLLSPDGIETIAHFTAENSPLLSNAILSIAIQESTGEVFIGTGDGLMSYMSDAVPVEDDFTNIYAYPNPVHPTYKGYVVIKGLMADTEVRIVDASGNLVTVLQGLGGEVIWDITNTSGNRVSSGVYTIICNTKGGNAYGTTKVLIMN